jgi:hypothetical protein
VDVLEIAPGLWRWTAFHEEWNEDVGCVYVETEDGVVLIDPLVPSDETAKFWKALDRDIKRAKAPVHVLVTVFWHTRSAAACGTRDAHLGIVAGRRRSHDAQESSPTRSHRETAPGGLEACRTASGGGHVLDPEHSALVQATS